MTNCGLKALDLHGMIILEKLNITANRDLVVVDNYFPNTLESLDISNVSNITLDVAFLS